MKISIDRAKMFLVLSSLLVSTALVASTPLAGPFEAEREQEPDTTPAVVRQDKRAAQAADIAILAHETGLSVRSLEHAIAFQQAFAEYADELISRFPDHISAVWMEPVPHTRGHIRFIGDVPSEVTSEIESLGLLDANNVALTSGSMISMADHARRAELAAEVLRELGYQESMTFFDPPNNVIQIVIQLPHDATHPSEMDIVHAVQNRLQDTKLQGRGATVDVHDLKLTVIEGSGRIITLTHSRGGNWLLDDGVRECTSGWSVSGPNGDGIITAGHCTGLNQFKELGVPAYSMTYRSGVFGALGDVEYHTTSHIELDDFYATSSTIRDVINIQTTSTMLGGTVCMYGRSSDLRTCNHVVTATNLTVNAGGTLVGKLVQATLNSSIGGDSGGGWSWGNTAWGLTHGYDANGNSYFMPVQEAQTALGVTVKTQ